MSSTDSEIQRTQRLKEDGYTFDIPFYQSTVSAGFPSPADDVIDMTLNLNTHIISNPAATFFVRASGDSMLDEGIHSGDLLVVNRAITAKSHDVVIAAINGELTVKQLYQKNGQVTLKARSAGFDDIPITDDMNMIIWGVVTHVIHGLRN
jgi:DNA polymerase V